MCNESERKFILRSMTFESEKREKESVCVCVRVCVCVCVEWLKSTRASKRNSARAKVKVRGGIVVEKLGTSVRQ